MADAVRNQKSILNLFYRLPSNLFSIFVDYWWWHLGAVVVTFLLVWSGFDWFYYKFFHDTAWYAFSFSAAVIGGLAPLLVPLGVCVVGWMKNNLKILNLGFALFQAAVLGSFISSVYKALSGRIYPPHSLVGATVDLTHVFKFGFLRGGVFWGWPSSHTTIAFAMSITLWLLFPKNKIIKYAAIIYALFIGLNVAISIHWFSDFAAGAIIGTVIGLVVGKSFYQRSELLGKNN